MPDLERLHFLLVQIHTQQAGDNEYQELLSIIQEDDSGAVVAAIDAFHATHQLPADSSYNAVEWQPLVQQILGADKPLQEDTHISTPPRRIAWYYAAAAITLLIIGAWLYKASSYTAPDVIIASSTQADVKPGGNKATLTLADGSVITLDSAGNGVLAQQGSTRIKKLANGQISYEGAGTKDGKLLYNTMSTPLGGQYKLMLPDGTLVWLNAGSSITYPAAFAGNERKVTITGEVYFEVASMADKAFIVQAGNTHIMVLGTNFNINAYTDEESIRTTLLQGAVKVSSNNKEHVLQPGQQSSIKANGDIQINDHANTQQVVAWKDGYFSFDNADLATVMRQLARWYNVEVSYDGQLPARTFSGDIGRNLTLDQVLKGLAKTRIKYRIENGNRIIILP
ncbi:FecR family protein [Chitinophaga sp. Hz27]|uniref:FecR family protein n=1 Tax=Chitinophaga sp. Hz27 TaxID=3347169 RepID=UPI0035E2A76B